MDVFLVKLSLIIGHIAIAMLPLIMNNLPQKYIHSGLTFVIKHSLKITTKVQIIASTGNILKLTLGIITSFLLILHLEYDDYRSYTQQHCP